MEKLNDALNEKLKSLSMEVCTVTLLINEFEGTIDLRTLCTRAAVSGDQKTRTTSGGGSWCEFVAEGTFDDVFTSILFAGENSAS